MLDENTKITLRNAIIAVSLFVSIASGYFYTLGRINDRLLALEKDQGYSDKYRDETTKRLDSIETNQIKILIALGVDPNATEK